MTARASSDARWDQRVARARTLAAEQPAAADALTFYAALAAFQKSLAMRPEAADMWMWIAFSTRSPISSRWLSRRRPSRWPRLPARCWGHDLVSCTVVRFWRCLAKEDERCKKRDRPRRGRPRRPVHPRMRAPAVRRTTDASRDDSEPRRSVTPARCPAAALHCRSSPCCARKGRAQSDPCCARSASPNGSVGASSVPHAANSLREPADLHRGTVPHVRVDACDRCQSLHEDDRSDEGRSGRAVRG